MERQGTAHFLLTESDREWRQRIGEQSLFRTISRDRPRLHAGYCFAGSLLFRIVRASTRPFKICPSPVSCISSASHEFS
jgi:hypothetical protein